jgi:hypothetical protein
MKHFLVVLVLLFLSIPVLAQHSGKEQRSGQHAQRSAPQQRGQVRGPQGTHNGTWGNHGEQRRQVGPGNHEVRPQQGRSHEWGSRRGRWPSNRATERQGFHDRYVGRNFYWSRCRWYGRPYYTGSRFLYGDFWFEIVEVVPIGWSPYDEVIIIEDGEDYFLYNPRYHARVSIVVVF